MTFENITLELPQELINTKIVEDFIFEISTKNFILDLNHIYHSIRVIWHYNKNWTIMKNNLQKECMKKGVKDSHIPLIEDTVDLNYNTITITQQGQEQGQEREREREQEQQQEQPEKSQAKILLELVKGESIFFKDQFKVPHTLVKIYDHNEVLAIESTKFRRYLSKLYYDKFENKIANSESIKNAIQILEAKADFEGQTIPLHLRTAWSSNNNDDDKNKGSIYYDLTDPKNRCVKITSDGWIIVNNQIEVLFRKYNHLSPQVEPLSIKKTRTTITTMREEEIESLETLKDDTDAIDAKILNEFMTLFNVKEEDNKLLLKCYIISLFIPDIPKPILLLHGEQGGAKSTFQELIKMLVDPSGIQTLTFPRDSNEFIQQLSHNYIVYYDNVSVIHDWISDLLCRAVTGSSFSKRALWTNDEDFYYNFRRVVGINGIDLAATKADLLDRSIIIQIERIDKTDRIKIEKIWEKFNEIKSQVLGCIFDILAKVLHYKNDHKEIQFPRGLNRMADWEEYAEIISRCMGNPEGEFQRVYQENIGVQVDEAIASSPLSMAVMELMTDRIKSWTGTPTELYIALNEIAETKLKINIQKIKSWPKSTSYLSRRLNGIKTNLREKGIEIKIGDKDNKDHRQIVIDKVTSVASMPSTPVNSSTKQFENIDDTENIDQVPSNVPSTKTSEIQAQYTDSRQHDDIDATLQTDMKHGQEGAKQKSQDTIHRKYQHSDIWVCDNCSLTGDKWFMIKHPCKNNNNNNKMKPNNLGA